MSVIDVLADFLGLIIGLMIGAVRLVKGVLKITGRFIVAMASDPTAQPQASQQPASSRRQPSGGGTKGLSSSLRFGGVKLDANLTTDGDNKPPDVVVADQEAKKPSDLASILQVSFKTQASKHYEDI